jgi:hypothetical protein
MVPPLDETRVGFGEGRIAKNTGVVNRINAVQAARDHTLLAAIRYAIVATVKRGRYQAVSE